MRLLLKKGGAPTGRPRARPRITIDSNRTLFDDEQPASSWKATLAPPRSGGARVIEDVYPE
jgi:hypothetical protein